MWWCNEFKCFLNLFIKYFFLNQFLVVRNLMLYSITRKMESNGLNLKGKIEICLMQKPKLDWFLEKVIITWSRSLDMIKFKKWTNGPIPIKLVYGCSSLDISNNMNLSWSQKWHPMVSEIAICSPNFVKLAKGRSRFCAGWDIKNVEQKARLFYVKPCKKLFSYRNLSLWEQNLENT